MQHAHLLRNTQTQDSFLLDGSFLKVKQVGQQNIHKDASQSLSQKWIRGFHREKYNVVATIIITITMVSTRKRLCFRSAVLYDILFLKVQKQMRNKETHLISHYQGFKQLQHFCNDSPPFVQLPQFPDQMPLERILERNIT